MVQAQKVERTSRHGVLGRYTACSTKRLKFYQTRWNAVVLCGTLPAYCIPKVVRMETGEVLYEKVYASPRPPPTISYKDNWTCDLDSDVARSSKDIQRSELKPNTQLSSSGTYLTLTKTGKNGPMKLRSDYRASVMMKIAYTTNQENQLKSPSI